MKREIRFKFWDNKAKRMINNPLIDKSKNINEIFMQNDDFEIMQYTGFKDKSNNDIFEDDIVFNDEDKKFYYVKFFNGCWFFVWLNDEKTYINADFYKHRTKVIGNIHYGQLIY